jgi:hypothetical protein
MNFKNANVNLREKQEKENITKFFDYFSYA